MMNLDFQCCLCGQGIVETNVDPLDINIMGFKKNYSQDRSSVTFYAHFECVKNKLHPYFQGYMIEDVFIIDEEQK